jgi:hypothetical protein
MKKLETKYDRYHGHQDKMAKIERLKKNPRVVSHHVSSDAFGGGGQIRYQILEDA